jgi:hypothetical protein
MITTILVADDANESSFQIRYEAVKTASQLCIVDATTSGKHQLPQHSYTKVSGISNIGPAIASIIPQIKTPFFSICLPNCTYYNNKLSASLKLISQYDFISCVYSDYQIYKNGTLIDTIEYPFDVRLINRGYQPNLNSLYRTSSIIQAQGIHFNKLINNSMFLHIPEPLFCEKPL